MYVVKLRKIGGNLLCTIPRPVMRELGWMQGDRAIVSVRKDNTVSVRKVKLHVKRG